MSNKDKKNNKKNNNLDIYKNHSDFFTLAIDRRIKNLNKKLTEIESLKKVKKENLKNQQIIKIERENEILKEIEDKNNMKSFYFESMSNYFKNKTPIFNFSENILKFLTIGYLSKNNNITEELIETYQEELITNSNEFYQNLNNFETNLQITDKKISNTSNLLNNFIEKTKLVDNFNELIKNNVIKEVKKDVKNEVKNEDLKTEKKEIENKDKFEKIEKNNDEIEDIKEIKNIGEKWINIKENLNTKKENYDITKEIKEKLNLIKKDDDNNKEELVKKKFDNNKIDTNTKENYYEKSYKIDNKRKYQNNNNKKNYNYNNYRKNKRDEVEYVKKE